MNRRFCGLFRDLRNASGHCSLGNGQNSSRTNTGSRAYHRAFACLSSDRSRHLRHAHWRHILLALWTPHGPIRITHCPDDHRFGDGLHSPRYELDNRRNRSLPRDYAHARAGTERALGGESRAGREVVRASPELCHGGLLIAGGHRFHRGIPGRRADGGEIGLAPGLVCCCLGARFGAGNAP
jgi:hypothetical protein